MAVELHIFMQDSRVPNREDWQHAIEELGFPTILDSSLNLRRDTGFAPTSYRGQPTGFELCLEPTADVLSSYAHMESKVAGRDRCATFRWGNDLTECAAALSAAAALTKLTDGVYFDPDDDVLYNVEEAIEAVRRDLSSIRP